MKEFTHEIVLIDEFCRWLEVQNIEYKREMRAVGTNYTDIVIRKENDLIGIEAKTNSFGRVLGQALGNQVFFAGNYVLYPRLPAMKYIKSMKKYLGVGLFIFDDSTESFKEIIKPKRSKWVNRRRYNRIKRHWNENKYAIREYNESELPKNYPLENLEKENLGSKSWTEVGLEPEPVYKPKREFKDITKFMEVD
jgi:hypothetical protein